MKELYQSQKEVLAEIAGRRRCALYCAPGTGKTFMSLVKLREIGNEVNLVVCQCKIVPDWVAEVQSSLPEYKVVDYTNKKNKIPADPSEYGEPFVGVINYDIVWRHPEFLKWRDFTLILDESSLLQNKKSKRTKFVSDLRFNAVVLLSGTPISGKYEKIYPQMKLLGYKKSYSYFLDEYANYELVKDNWTGVRYIKINSYKNIDKLRAELHNLGCVFRSQEEICELPPVTEKTIYVKPRKELRTFAKDRIVEIDGDLIEGRHTLSRRIGMRKICSCYNPEKTKVLRDLLDSLEGYRVIVFYPFKKDLEIIKEVVGNRHFSYVNGQGRNLDNHYKYEDTVTAVQYQSGSFGLNLQDAHYVIRWSPTESAEDWDQSVKRIRRNGQKEKQMVYNIVTEKSIEVNIVANVSKGIDYTDALFIKDYPE